MTQPDEFDLDAAFMRARAEPVKVSDALLAQIMADAQAHLPRVPVWRRAMAAIGGPAGLGGLVTATVAGLWIGVAPPAAAMDPLVLAGAVQTITDEAYTDLTGFGWDSLEEQDNG